MISSDKAKFFASEIESFKYGVNSLDYMETKQNLVIDFVSLE